MVFVEGGMRRGGVELLKWSCANGLGRRVGVGLWIRSIRRLRQTVVIFSFPPTGRAALRLPLPLTSLARSTTAARPRPRHGPSCPISRS